MKPQYFLLFVPLFLFSNCFSHSERVKGGFSSISSIKLKTLDGVPFDLAKEVKKHRLTVLFWWSTTCPCVRRYRDRIHQIAERYNKRGVAVFAIASNADDTPPKIAEVAKEMNFQLKILYDPRGKLAKYFGVVTTPTTVVLDREGKVRYFGWIDNEHKPGESGRIPYLENALEQLLSGQKVSLPRGPFYGCMITKDL